jgi:hypothetical protein
MKEISRKKFLRTMGTMVAGGAIMGVSGALIAKKAIAPGFSESAYAPAGDAFVSPYKRISSFAVPDHIEAFEQYGGKLYAATANAVWTFDYHGKPLHRFPAGEGVRGMAVDDEGIYLLYPAKIEVYTQEGKLLREWEACSELSNYCSFVLAAGWVFVTDMENKNICKYTNKGVFVKFITSPNTFVIPSLTFGVAYANGYIYCSNSGKHQVERYTIEGEYVDAFGRPGGAPGSFAGCCNPVYLTAANGEIITSEKGVPRISCYGSEGKFRSLLLDSASLGGGHAAYPVKIWEDRLFIAGANHISVFGYDERLAQLSACGGCGVACPLRKGVIS